MTTTAICGLEVTMPTAACLVYRFYDADDRLLYIGATEDLPQRIRRHASEQPWWGRVARVTSEPYPTRETALSAEAEAIKAEHPAKNVAHSAKSVLFGSELRFELIDFIDTSPGARQRDAVVALGIERAVVSSNVRALVAGGILVPGTNRSYTVDHTRISEISASVDDSDWSPSTPVPDVAAATATFGHELRVQLVRYFAAHPNATESAAVATLGTPLEEDIAALVETGVLVQAEDRTYSVDRDRFDGLIRALADFGTGK